MQTRGSRKKPIERERPQSWTKPLPPVTMPGEYRKVVPAVLASYHAHDQAMTNAQQLGRVAFAWPLAGTNEQNLALRTGLVDLNYTTVGDLLQQPQQRGLVVSHARILILGTYVAYANRLPRKGAANKTLPEVLAASEV